MSKSFDDEYGATSGKYIQSYDGADPPKSFTQGDSSYAALNSIDYTISPNSSVYSASQYTEYKSQPLTVGNTSSLGKFAGTSWQDAVVDDIKDKQEFKSQYCNSNKEKFGYQTQDQIYHGVGLVTPPCYNRPGQSITRSHRYNGHTRRYSEYRKRLICRKIKQLVVLFVLISLSYILMAYAKMQRNVGFIAISKIVYYALLIVFVITLIRMLCLLKK
jgi:hypothetical protein